MSCFSVGEMYAAWLFHFYISDCDWPHGLFNNAEIAHISQLSTSGLTYLLFLSRMSQLSLVKPDFVNSSLVQYHPERFFLIERETLYLLNP